MCCRFGGPCCFGPCETRITTGAKIIFRLNLGVLIICIVLCVWSSLFPLIVPDLVLIAINALGLAGLRKNSGFLPVPATCRAKLKLRDKHQYCLLVPWLCIYGLITAVYLVISVPLGAGLVTLLVNNSNPVPPSYGPPRLHSSLFLLLHLSLTMFLPYQWTVVYRCLKVVKKGGQHYVVPELQETFPWGDQDLRTSTPAESVSTDSAL